MNPLLILAALILAACSPLRPRGEIALLSPAPVQLALIRLSDQPVTGRSCFPDKRVDVFSDEPVVRQALDAALAQTQGATMLTDVVIEDQISCIQVTGYPVRIAQ